MVLHLLLSPEAEANLRVLAAAEGKDIERFVLDAVQDKLTQMGTSATADMQAPTADVSSEAWIRAFDAWVESHPSRGYVADDSRESIYAERGL